MGTEDTDKKEVKTSWTGEEILAVMEVDIDSDGKIDLSIKDDPRLPPFLSFTKQIHDAYAKHDASLMPQGISPEIGAAIIASKGELKEKLIAEQVQTKYLSLWDGFDSTTALAAEQNTKQLIEKAEGAQKFSDGLTSAVDIKAVVNNQSINRGLEYLKKNSSEIQALVGDAFASSTQQKINSSKEISEKNFKDKNGVENTKDFGKGSPRPDVGLICRHSALIMAGGLTNAGVKANAFLVNSHMTVGTEEGNISESTASDPKDVYQVVIFGDVNQNGNRGVLFLTPNNQARMHILTRLDGDFGSEKLKSFFNLTIEEIILPEKLELEIAKHPEVNFYNECIAQPGKVDAIKLGIDIKPLSPTDIKAESPYHQR